MEFQNIFLSAVLSAAVVLMGGSDIESVTVFLLSMISLKLSDIYSVLRYKK